jgi:hypothetical protein
VSDVLKYETHQPPHGIVSAQWCDKFYLVEIYPWSHSGEIEFFVNLVRIKSCFGLISGSERGDLSSFQRSKQDVEAEKT